MQSLSNLLVVMRGYPGTGKSTIARAIAAALHAPLIDRDVIRQTGVAIFGEHPEIGRFAYEMMFALTRAQLNVGISVVVDSPLTYRTTYEEMRHIADDAHVPMLVVHCICSAQVQRQRLESRKGAVSAFQITSWEDWLQWKPRFEQFSDGGYEIDTGNSLEDSLAKILYTIHELRTYWQE